MAEKSRTAPQVPEVKVGEVWVECDPRRSSTLRGKNPPTLHVLRVGAYYDGSEYVVIERRFEIGPPRTTTVKRERFHGRRGGYRRIRDEHGNPVGEPQS